MLTMLLLLTACQERLDALEDTSSPTPIQEDADADGLGEVKREAPPVLFARPKAPVMIPEGRAVTRDCYGGARRDRGSSSSVMPPTASPSRARQGARQSPSSADPSFGSGALGRVAPGRVAPAPLEESAAMPSPDSMAAEPRKEARKMEADERTASGRPTLQDGAESESAPVAPLPRTEKEWGGTIYLSNDDSMSLASAQRVLWALQQGSHIPVSQVRPHELLNYFSFETEPVEDGAMFSIHSSAERTGPEALTMALAVRGASPPRLPLDLTVLVDRSGSMWAEGRMEYVKRGLSVMTESLQRGDRMDLVLFDHEVCTPLEDFVVGRDDPAILDEAIGAMTPRGSTNLDLGLKESYRLALGRVDEEAHRNRRVMMLTDAFLNTGDVNPDSVSEISKAHDEHGIRLTGIGVGRDFNDGILDKLTEKGKGAYVYLGSEAVVDRVFGLGFESLTRTIAHDVRFALELPDSLAMERFYGEESSRDPEAVAPLHYYAGTTQLYLQDLLVDPDSFKPSDKVRFVATWKDATTGEDRRQEFSSTVGRMLRQPPHNPRKGMALMAWSDMVLAAAMGDDPCGAPLATYRERIAKVEEDVELAYVNGLVSKQCGVDLSTPPAVARGVSYKVRIDADLPIAEVTLSCPSGLFKEPLGAGENVVVFSVEPGPCKLMLQGNVPMETSVEVPATGGALRCILRGGRLSCT